MRPVARLQAFGGGYIPRAVAAEIEFRRKQRGLSQNKLASLVGRSQGQLANALRGHDPISGTTAPAAGLFVFGASGAANFTARKASASAGRKAGREGRHKEAGS
jgi:transcriptional regulator with XRE-family HTH domain